MLCFRRIAWEIIAASEALRQATNTVVKVYSALEAAGPAQAYDPSATTLSLGSFDIGEPNCYLLITQATAHVTFLAPSELQLT